MTTRKDRKEILDSLEDEFRSDLSIHLYSTVLLHRVNPYFPRRQWSAWPLDFDDVPIPKHEYEDNLIINEGYYDKDIEVDYDGYRRVRNQYKKSRDKTRSIVSNDNEDESEEEEDSDSDNESSDQEQDIQIKKQEYDPIDLVKKPIIKVTMKESVPNSKTLLLNELSSQIQSKINQKISKMKQHGKINDSLETSDSMSSNVMFKQLSHQLANRFDNMLNELLTTTTNTTSQPIGWQRVLQSALTSEKSPYKKLNTETYRKLYSRCEDAFENIQYNYEFDDLEEDMPQDDIEVIGKNGFNVVNYLMSLKDEQSTSGRLPYEGLAKEYLLKREAKLEQSRTLKHQFFKMLEIQEKYQEMDWDKHIKRSRKKQRIALEEDLSNVEELRRMICQDENNTIDEDTYLINK
ncbi:uncharacterized protein J8A68_000170 [[Candida] subhashii]|uniref:Rrn9 domain-containing protein n=1 Tax=[Candida] subhashii TaxID=561895 RepID=A0A8J5QIN7_9ASCO|nr:uncharacterized protein J8A68_000170 [[Candida] subhashii]KAG7666299.1 hypothetical protein J8A68_000170 [[Candida] subhashii]